MSWNDNSASLNNKRRKESSTIELDGQMKKSKRSYLDKRTDREEFTPARMCSIRENERSIYEASTSKSEPSVSAVKIGGNYLKLMERKIDISINDNAELRKTLIDRCENIVIQMGEQLSAGVLPKISYKMTSINTLMEQIETNDSFLDQYEDTFDSLSSFDESPFDESGNLESLGYETQEPEIGNETIEEYPEKKVTVKFRSRRSQEKFTLIMTTLAKVHRLLIDNETQTRRSFFYELKSNDDTSTLITDSRQIDRIVNTIANLLGCGPSDTGLIGTAKGLGAGDLTLTLANGEKINYSIPGGVLIPQIVSNVISIRTRAERVIVVEKDAVFQKLLDENCASLLNCILITGKGFPDVPTRMLVRILAKNLKLPVYILVDADPYGIEIMFTYKYGSMNLSYEQGNKLACASARWIGVHPSDIEKLKMPIIPLTEPEITKLEAIKTRPYVSPELLRELTIMRQGKTGIEAIKNDSHEYKLTCYLSRKIQNGDYI